MAQGKTEFRLLMSPFTRKICAGHVEVLGVGTALSTGARYDVTNDFLSAVIQYGQSHKGAFEIVSGGEVWDVTVTKRAAKAAKENT